jgi:hypothetical protein
MSLELELIEYLREIREAKSKQVMEQDKNAGKIETPVFPQTRDHTTEPLKDFGMTNSSVKPRFALIPSHALEALAARFELGEEKHKGKSWNALADQKSLENRDWILSRAEHAIYHIYKYISKMEGLIPDDGDDDAAAIMWAGTVLSEAKRLYNHRKDRK